jgi:hypothetical protein
MEAERRDQPDRDQAGYRPDGVDDASPMERGVRQSTQDPVAKQVDLRRCR